VSGLPRENAVGLDDLCQLRVASSALSGLQGNGRVFHMPVSVFAPIEYGPGGVRSVRRIGEVQRMRGEETPLAQRLRATGRSE